MLQSKSKLIKYLIQKNGGVNPEKDGLYIYTNKMIEKGEKIK